MQPNTLRRTLIGGLVVIVCILVALLLWAHNENNLRVEVFKITYQFVSITCLGGLVFFLLNLQKEKEERGRVLSKEKEGREQLRREAIQALDSELDDTYRDMKSLKRRVRVKLMQSAGSMAEEKFHKLVDEVHEVQLSIEKVRERIARRSDMLGMERINRIKGELRYAARYLLDVFEIVEKGRVRPTNGLVSLEDTNCWALKDFSRVRDEPPEAKAFQIFKDEEKSLTQRFEAFEQIENGRKERKHQGQDQRYATVAFHCFDLASLELREALYDDLPPAHAPGAVSTTAVGR